MKECRFDPMETGRLNGWETIGCTNGAVLFRKGDAGEGDWLWLDHEFAGFGYTCLGRNDIEGSHTAVYRDDKGVYTLSWTPFEQVCRLVADPVTATPEAAETASVCEVLVTQLRLLYCSADCGMGYVIRLADGRFVVIDCGVGEYDEPAHLLALLAEQNVRPGKPEIAAWFFTHPHSDHFGTFVRLMEKYGDRLAVTALAYNWPTRDMAAGFSDLTGFDAVLAGLPDVDIITPRSGWTFAYPGVTFTVLFACEDLYPTPYRDINNTSLVLRMDVGDDRFLWLGDCSGAASDYICRKYTAETLGCRFLQVGHHGYWGGSDTLYRTVSPEVLFWPCPDFWYQEITHWDCNRALVKMPEDSPLVGDLPLSAKEGPRIQKIYVSGRQEVTVTPGQPLPAEAPEVPGDHSVILSEDFASGSVFEKGWASITGGQTGYGGMKIQIEEGKGTFAAGERRSLCELVRPDLMPDAYRVTLAVTAMDGEVGLVFNHQRPTIWEDEKYLSFGSPEMPCCLTLTVDKTVSLSCGGTVVYSADYVPAEKHGLYLTVQNGAVTLEKILVEKL